MIKIITSLLIVSVLAGCAMTQNERMGSAPKPVKMPVMMQKEFDKIAGPAGGQPITVALYGFTDKTGQRRPQQNIASLSTAVTQGGEMFLIKALQDVGQGKWFKVVERVGIDGLTRERQLIRQMREAYDGSNAKPLPPMIFAGILLEGGIVGYDSSVKSGGMAARWLGIGPQTQYSEDVVTVSIRAISVSTGEVLAAVTMQKTIVSAGDSIAAMKFFDVGTKAFEFETGLTVNEPGTFAVKSAIEAAVLELIKEGARKGIWAIEDTKPGVITIPVSKQEPKVEPKKEDAKKEEPKVEVEVKQEPKEEPKEEVKPEEPKVQEVNTHSSVKEPDNIGFAQKNKVLEIIPTKMSKPTIKMKLEGKHAKKISNKKQGNKNLHNKKKKK